METKTIDISSPWCSTITEACERATALAKAESVRVEFTFNGTPVHAEPGETPGGVEDRWRTDMDAAAKAGRESPECAERERKQAEEWAAKLAATLVETASTESEMREATSPWPYTPEQLTQYIGSLVDRSHDYGTCCYAMSLAATAAFNYVAHKLGVTGFQASCADLDFLRRSRHLNGPFMILKAEDALYPQYDLHGKLQEAMDGWKQWLKDEAAKKLAETESAHPRVTAHWKTLAQ